MIDKDIAPEALAKVIRDNNNKNFVVANHVHVGNKEYSVFNFMGNVMEQNV